MRSSLVSSLPRPVADRLRAAKRALITDWADEPQIIAKIVAARPGPPDGMLVDVGAHWGAVTELFLELGWSVVAYEPDPCNREQFQQRVGLNPRVQLSSAAISDTPTKSASLFTSPTSTGISTLSAFHDSHEPTTTVEVVTLREDLSAREVRRVDFLKVDIEGFDLFALKGFDWTYAPRFVVFEFEDRKTCPLGYSLADSSLFAASHGYNLIYSVWEPIVEYGTRHRWRGLFTDPPLDSSECWGNVICFRDKADADYCVNRFGSSFRRLLGELWHG